MFKAEVKLQFMRGKFRQCWSTTLRERCRARLASDVVPNQELAALCLSCCCTGHGVQVLCRNELCRFRGKWIQLLDAVCHAPRSSSYVWTEEVGVQHTRLSNMRVANKATLMPLLVSLGIHDALAEVQQHLELGECLFAFMDDVCVTGPVAHRKDRHNVAGERPEDMEDLGLDLWNPQGVKILGSPVG